MNDESDKVKNYTKLIRRYLNISKPNGVLEIKFEITPTGDENEYYMKVTYVVPDDSKYLQQDKPHNPNVDFINYRYFWGDEIRKTIKNYFGVNVIINSSSTQSESYYNRQKQYD